MMRAYFLQDPGDFDERNFEKPVVALEPDPARDTLLAKLRRNRAIAQRGEFGRTNAEVKDGFYRDQVTPDGEQISGLHIRVSATAGGEVTELRFAKGLENGLVQEAPWTMTSATWREFQYSDKNGKPKKIPYLTDTRKELGPQWASLECVSPPGRGRFVRVCACSMPRCGPYLKDLTAGIDENGAVTLWYASNPELEPKTFTFRKKVDRLFTPLYELVTPDKQYDRKRKIYRNTIERWRPQN
jgi:hypothetical protein